MEIIKRAIEKFKFTAAKLFMKDGKPIKVGDEVEISPDEQTIAVASGRVFPSDLPEQPSVYIVLKDFVLPGSIEKHEAKRLELVSLRAEDGLKLMIEGTVIPKDEHRWRPGNRRLQQAGPDRKKKVMVTAAPSCPDARAPVKMIFTKDSNVLIEGKGVDYAKGDTAEFTPYLAAEIIKAKCGTLA